MAEYQRAGRSARQQRRDDPQRDREMTGAQHERPDAPREAAPVSLLRRERARRALLHDTSPRGNACSASTARCASSARTSSCTPPLNGGYIPPASSARTIDSISTSSSTPCAISASTVEGNVETTTRSLLVMVTPVRLKPDAT